MVDSNDKVVGRREEAMHVDGARRKLLYKVAMAYYADDLTQEQIAQRFSLSRIKVSRMLQQARQERIVQISIIAPPDPKPDLERKLEARYGLDEVIVVSPGSDERQALARELGAAAAEYLARCLQGQETVAMSWGSTLRAVVDALPAQNWPEMRVVQITGGLGRPEAETHGADLTRRLAEAFNARPVMLSAPGIVTSKLVRDALMADPQVADALALAARADVALVGLGAPTPDAVVMQLGNILARTDIEQVKMQGAVGDIALRFFDEMGSPIAHEINDRIIGLDVAQIKRIPRVIGVAGGKDKLAVIRAAARGHLVSVLITDEVSAESLLEDKKTS
jgi:DNA-binding transcriptional regulator LsrR (DeoR family)